jgi:hypothetical protein
VANNVARAVNLRRQHFPARWMPRSRTGECPGW